MLFASFHTANPEYRSRDKYKHLVWLHNEYQLTGSRYSTLQVKLEEAMRNQTADRIISRADSLPQNIIVHCACLEVSHHVTRVRLFGIV